MLTMDLLLPLMMIVFGKYFLKKAPKKINVVFGYRTSMSMKYKYSGTIWYLCRILMLPIIGIFMFLVIGKDEDCIGSVG